jgi:hypothetical protein
MRSLLKVLVLAAVMIVAVADPRLSASRADSVGDPHNTVIIWDGSTDVPVSNGSGVTGTVADLGLVNPADLAVLVTVDTGGVPDLPLFAVPPGPGNALTVLAVHLLLRSNAIAAACPPGATTPNFCTRVHPLSEIISRESLGNININPNFTRKTREQIGALPTIGLTLTEAELRGLWRLPPAEQAVLTEMIGVLGAGTIRIGLDSEIHKDPASVINQVRLRDYNLPVSLTSNDNFANRIGLAGTSVTAYGSLRTATAEPGEPSDSVGAGAGTPSIWWSYIAPCSFSVSSPDSFIDTQGSTTDTVLGLFSGLGVLPNFGGLTWRASDDDSGGSGTSRIPSASAVPGPTTLDVTAGELLHIRVRSKSGAASGDITLHINTPCVDGPPAPVVTAVKPSAGRVVGQGTDVAVQGANFVPGVFGTLVSLGGTTDFQPVVLTPRVLLATARPHLPGAVAVVVTNSDGQSGTLDNGFTYLSSTPTVTALSSTVGPSNGGREVFVFGTGFVSGLSVRMGGVLVPSAFVLNDTTIRLTTLPHAQAAVDIVVTNPEGTSATLAAGYTYIAAAPGISSIVATTGPTDGGTLVTINGASFVSGASVTFGGVAASGVTVVNASKITLTLPPHAAGVVDVAVANPDTQAFTAVSGFTYVGAHPSPISIFPNIGPSRGGVPVRISGINFAPGATVTIGNFDATDVRVVNSGTIIATIGCTFGSFFCPNPPGPADVVVTNPGDTVPGVLTNGYLFVDFPDNDYFDDRDVLTVPSSGPLVARSNIDFASYEGGEPSDLIANANGTVGKFTPSLWWEWTPTCSFTVSAPSSFIDTAGSALDEFSNVDTILGVFTSSTPNSPTLASLLRLASDDDFGFKRISQVPSPTPGPTPLSITAGTKLFIRVRTYASSASGPIVLRINSPCNAAPTVTSITPATGQLTGGTPVTIDGTNFVSAATVSFGGVPATSVVVVNTSTITAVTGAHASGAVDVVVTNPDLQSAALTNGFTYATPPPTVLTAAASDVRVTRATLNGTVNPNGTAASGFFQFGSTIAYGGSTPAVALGAGSAPVTIPGFAVSGLHCQTTYHFRAVATNAGGMANGSDATFTTAPCTAPRRSDFDGDGLANLAAFRPGTGLWTIQGQPDRQWGLAGDLPVPGDYDGDGNLDLAVYRPSTGEWFIEGQPVIQWGRTGDIPVPGDYDNDGITDIAVYRTSDDVFGRWFVRNRFTRSWGLRGDVPVAADYDGDGKTDLAVYRPGTHTWYIAYSATGFATAGAFQRGQAGDVPVAGDFDGDHRADLAMFTPSGGASGLAFWDIAFSSLGYAVSESHQFGKPGDVPLALDIDGDGVDELVVYRASLGDWFSRNRVTSADIGQHVGLPGNVPVFARPQLPRAAADDLDGDGRADFTVFRPSNGLWFVRRSATGYDTNVAQWGLDGDLKVPGDYDGDHKADIAVYRPSTGEWYLFLSMTQSPRVLQWGLPSDTPLPADYDGDGRTDLAVFRPSTGEWFIRLSSSDYGTYSVAQWGLSTDRPVPADYDGDGRADLAIYRPSSGQWFLKLTTLGYGSQIVKQWGLPTDVPAPADVDGDGRADLVVYRPSTGQWFAMDALTGINSVRQWGLPGDIAVPHDFDGDGIADLAIYRTASGEWYVMLSSTGSVMVLQWGLPLDQPLDIPPEGGSYRDRWARCAHTPPIETASGAILLNA